MKHPFSVWVLVVLLISLALGGFSGGIPMLMDPQSGGYLDFGHLLADLPVNSFLLPGLFLSLFLGIFPLILAYALIAKPSWAFADRFLSWPKYHWSWIGTIILVIGLAIWLTIEGILIGWWPITTITAVQGGLILIMALLPELRNYSCPRKAE